MARSSLTIDASDLSDDLSDGKKNLQVDRHNNVVRRNILDDEQSDVESLDLARLPTLPQARYTVMEKDSDSHLSDAYTVRESFAPGFKNTVDKPPTIYDRESSSRKLSNYQRTFSARQKKLKNTTS